ncbi:MAG: amidohydrolase family protein [Oscillospiraceae bacterium]|nr:amidohydrolase family protein [Oscillospiraceae bacterium]
MKYAIVNAKILSGHKDMVPEEKALLIENGRIAAISEDAGSFGNVKTVDMGGKYLMPGLVNLHVHLPGSGMPKHTKRQNAKSVRLLMSNPITRGVIFLLCYKYARTQLMSGVTTIRTVGGLGHVDTDIRNSINSGRLTGPRILASNMAVSVPGGHMAGVLAYEAVTAEDCVKFVDRIAEDKPDLIKLMVTGGVLDAKAMGEPGELKMQPELIRACCDEAHRLGFQVAAHVESPEGLKAALENGVDTIEHGAFTDEDMVRLFKERKAAAVCTVSPTVPLSMFDPEVSHSTEMTRFNGNVVFEGVLDCARKGLEHGYAVGIGTDTACPFITHYDTWRELCYFKKYLGVSNAFALHTATEVNANIVGLGNETGTVEPGKSADFLVTEKNPLDDLQALRKPAAVIMRGRLIKNPRVKKFDYVENELDKYL